MTRKLLVALFLVGVGIAAPVMAATTDCCAPSDCCGAPCCK